MEIPTLGGGEAFLKDEEPEAKVTPDKKILTPHEKIQELMDARAKSGAIFGTTWRSTLGFFAPFGHENSFYQRLKRNPSFKCLFVFEQKVVDNHRNTLLSQELESAPVSVSDVDAAVNTCALVCALLLGLPASIMSSIDSDSWNNYIEGQVEWTGSQWIKCKPSGNDSLYSDACLRIFSHNFVAQYNVIIGCFYSALCTLVTAVFYYMCRPSESCNNSSLLTLFEAFTIEVRKKIRKERPLTDADSKLDPKVPFRSSSEEAEVFMRAKFLAMNEVEEQKNQECESSPHLIHYTFVFHTPPPQVLHVVQK
jgi:hypothetical protein